MWVENRFLGQGWSREQLSGDNATAQAVDTLADELAFEFLQCEQELMEWMARGCGPPFDETGAVEAGWIRECARQRGHQ